MNTAEANKIIETYEATLAKGTVGETVLRKNSWLIEPKAMVQFAYFVVLEDAVSSEQVYEEQITKLVKDYSSIEYFVADDLADKYAEYYADWQKKKNEASKSKVDEGHIKTYVGYSYALKLRSADLEREVYELITNLKG